MVHLLYIWIRSHVKCEGITFTKFYLPKASPIFTNQKLAPKVIFKIPIAINASLPFIHRFIKKEENKKEVLETFERYLNLKNLILETTNLRGKVSSWVKLYKHLVSVKRFYPSDAAKLQVHNIVSSNKVISKVSFPQGLDKTSTKIIVNL